VATVAVERVAMGWRRDAEGTSKGRRVPLTRMDDLHDAEGTSKGCPFSAKGCPFTSKGCPFTSKGHVEGMSLHNKGTLVMIDFDAICHLRAPYEHSPAGHQAPQLLLLWREEVAVHRGGDAPAL
jgi:hypothetical protein